MTKRAKVLAGASVAVLGAIGAGAAFLVARHSPGEDEQESTRPPPNCEACADGRGTDYFFPASAFTARALAHNELAVPETSLIAKKVQSCECRWSYLRRNGALAEVSEGELAEKLAAYQRECNGCVLVQKVGWPERGRVTRLVDGAPVP